VNPATVVVKVAQKAIGRLTRCFRQMYAPSYLYALNLPLEIILMIAAHLDECTLVSLALTRQSLYYLWKPRSLPLQLAEKEKLLLLFEKGIPFLCYCHYFVKLHRWYRHSSRSVALWYEERQPCRRNTSNHSVLSPTFYAPYYYARLAMNRHFYGSKHGLPLHSINGQPQS